MLMITSARRASRKPKTEPETTPVLMDEPAVPCHEPPPVAVHATGRKVDWSVPAKAKTAKAPKPTALKPMSQLDAAAAVLGKHKGDSFTVKELLGMMTALDLWASPAGKTPAATLSAALVREIARKGDKARFRKTAPGRFALNEAAEK